MLSRLSPVSRSPEIVEEPEPDEYGDYGDEEPRNDTCSCEIPPEPESPEFDMDGDDSDVKTPLAKTPSSPPPKTPTRTPIKKADPKAKDDPKSGSQIKSSSISKADPRTEPRTPMKSPPPIRSPTVKSPTSAAGGAPKTPITPILSGTGT